VVVPFGANLNREPSEIEVEQWIENRPTDVCRLVFLAVEWERKQGSVALAVAESLNRRGQRCELTVVGCRPPDAAALPKWVKVVGFIDRNIPSTEARLAEILSQAHFLILPSRADCTPLAIAEANAFGVPVLTTRTGGIPSMVRDGVNGWCLPLGSALAASLADHAAALMAEAGHYHAIARSARREYVERLNWKTSGRRIREMLGKI
jgi:glycosyltransferase involved in cell wall biosynthesis